MNILGIDIGGSGIKGALIDAANGEMLTDRLRIPTPQPSSPTEVIKVVKQLVDHFEYTGPLGVGIPSIVINGVVLSAANIDDRWINFPGREGIAQATGCPVTLMNDADVAGFAEMRFGAGRGEDGVVMIFTLGTGIGSCMFVHGQIVPNLELGHIYLPRRKHDAEYYASDRARKDGELSWKKWAKRLNEYFAYIEALFSPELLIIGGGVSKKYEEFAPYLKTRARVVPAQLRNEAGIIGAATAVMSKQ